MHPEPECPICHTKKFLKETRKFVLKGSGNPDAVFDCAVCATCGNCIFAMVNLSVG